MTALIAEGLRVLQLLILFSILSFFQLIEEVLSSFTFEVAVVLAQKSIFMLVLDVLNNELSRTESFVTNFAHILVTFEYLYFRSALKLTELRLQYFDFFCFVKTVLIFSLDQKFILLRIFQLLVRTFSQKLFSLLNVILLKLPSRSVEGR